MPITPLPKLLNLSQYVSGVSPVAPTANVDAHGGDPMRDGPASGHHPSGPHAHAAHRNTHGPTPRPRRNTTAKPSASRRRKRVHGAGEDDDPEIHDNEDDSEDAARIVLGHADAGSDDESDREEGQEEQGRQERIERAREFSTQRRAAPETRGDDSPSSAGAAPSLALDHFVQASRSAVAHWRPGDRAGRALQREKLRALLACPADKPLDAGGLERVIDHLQATDRQGGNVILNLMLPLLLLQLQLPRTPEQRKEALARLCVSLQGSGG